MEKDGVGCGTLNFACVFDDYMPLIRELAHHLRDKCVCESRLAGTGSPDYEKVLVLGYDHAQGVFLAFRQNSGFNVFIKCEDPGGRFADCEGRRGHDGRQGSGESESTGIFAVELGLVIRECLAKQGGEGTERHFGVSGTHGADTFHRLTEPFLPDPPVGVQHDFAGHRVFQSRVDKLSHVCPERCFPAGVQG